MRLDIMLGDGTEALEQQRDDHEAAAAADDRRQQRAAETQMDAARRDRRRHRREDERDRPQQGVVRDVGAERLELGLLVEEGQQRLGDRRANSAAPM